MKQLFFCVCIFIFLLSSNAFSQDYQKSIIEFQKELNRAYKNPDESPLTKKDRRKFKKHSFFPINEAFRVTAKFERIKESNPFKMKTTTERQAIYEIYGIATFVINGIEYKLNIYQSHQLRTMEKYKNYLFLPFTDKSNGTETYGGGRYIDLQIPTGDTIIIDFNKAYNHKYSCPIPPAENNLDLYIKAGIMYLSKN